MNTQNLEFAEQAAITASAVPDELRIGFWPQHFGSVPQWITLESCIFDWMDRLCTDYHGGIWSFLTLSNGGAFMAPESEHDEKWALFNSMNGNGAELTGDAMTEHYYRLRDFALNHPECSAIMHLID